LSDYTFLKNRARLDPKDIQLFVSRILVLLERELTFLIQELISKAPEGTALGQPTYPPDLPAMGNGYPNNLTSYGY